MTGLRRHITELPLWGKAAAITLLALVISKITVYDLMSVSFFSPMEKAVDFRFSDFYTVVADDRAVKSLNSDITIVAVDGCNRSEIARAIDDIDYCSPAAVGLDIAFSAPRDTAGDPLAASLASCANLVMPVVAEENGATYTMSHRSHYDAFMDSDRIFAAVNIEGEAESRATTRDFSPRFMTDGNGYIPSMALALVNIAAPEKTRQLLRRDNADEAIVYASRDFEVVTPEEIIDNEELITGKIVLVGKLHDAGDMHSTPTDNFMPGLLIHAHTIATIMDGDYTRRLTPTENLLLSTLFCYIIVVLNLRLTGSSLGSLMVRAIQLGMLYLMIMAGTVAYIKFNIDLNFAQAMLMTALGVAACDIFDGIFADDGILDRISVYINKIKTVYDNKKNNPADSGDTVGDAGNG